MRSRDLHNWMWAEALSLLDEAERRQRQFFRLAAGKPGRGDLAPPAPAWEPPVDVIETGDGLLVVVALPGVAAADVSISIGDDLLTVTAQRSFPACGHGSRIHRVEIPYGRFERHIALPSRSFELVERTLAAGCLTLAFRWTEGDKR